MLIAIWADDDEMIEIRQAEEKDLPPTVAIWQDRIAVVQQSDRLCRPTPDGRALWLSYARRWIVDDQFGFFVAGNEEMVAGYIVVTIVEGVPGLQPNLVGRVADMAVDLHQSYSGLSCSLLHQAQAWLRTREIDIMTVDVPAFYPVEAAFWRASGARQRYVQHWLAF